MSIFAFKIAAKLHKKPEITLIICTHNRADVLRESLSKYVGIQSELAFEILIVLNACTDKSKKVVEEFATTLPQLSWVEEEKIGHSNARNCGYKNAKANFVFYIDDDAYPAEDLITLLGQHLKKQPIDCISGRTIYWPAESPKWIVPSLVEVPKFRNDFGPLPEGTYINGCACGFSIKALELVGGFNAEIGMKGKELGYFDEVYVQEKLAHKNVSILYDAALEVYHKSHIQTAKGFLKAAYAKGKSRKFNHRTYRFKTLIGFMLSTLRGVLYFVKDVFKMPVKTALVKHLSTPFVYLGQLFG